MQYDRLTDRQHDVIAEFPATAADIAAELSIGVTTVHDHISGIRKAGVPVAVTNDGEFYENGTDAVDEDVLNVSAPLRTTSKTKAAISRATREFLTELEHEIKGYRAEVGPVIADGGLSYTPGGMDIIIPCSDDHFGDMVPDPKSRDPYKTKPLFDSQIAADRVRAKFNAAHSVADVREDLGYTIDTVHIPLLGDLCTNEAIYEAQKWHLEPGMHIRNQLKLATNVYGAEIERASRRFPSVNIPCFHGNHGEFRQGGQSSHANADDLLYDRLELYCHTAGLDNVTFVRSDIDDHINFTVRDGRWKGYAVHGENVGTHIGTKSPLSWWLSQLTEHQYDFAFRCHYHESKEERVNGRPVHMLPSIKDGGDYEAKLGIYSKPSGVIFGCTDEIPLAWKEWVTF